MRAYYSDHFVLPLPDGHRFPMQKYALLRERITTAGVISAGNLRVPQAASDEQLHLVHEKQYAHRVRVGELSAKEIRRIGFPWSPQLVERSCRSVGGTIEACRVALIEGAAVNLAGGTHHAFADHGEGFCVFNDVATAARAMQAEDRVRRVVILDCDVHQGNGTAAIFSGDRSVFTFSIHGAKNFPFRKVSGDLDIALPDGTTDANYLEALYEGVERSLALAGADLAIYLAGADPYEGDRLGRLNVSKTALAERDRFVLEACRAREIPVAVVMAGGYASQVEDIVDIHFKTVQLAAALFS